MSANTLRPAALPHEADDHFRDECGVFGIYGHPDAAAHTALGLHALQHRGQEAAGIVTYDGDHFYAHRALGLVGDNFNRPELIHGLKGPQAIGHVRYSTAGETMLRNVQPLFAELSFGGVSMAHNGNLTNAFTLRKQLISKGCLFQSTSDTEVIVHLMAVSTKETMDGRLLDAMEQIQGAYSLLVMSEDLLIAARDPLGVRPLVLGKLDDAWVVASETCAFDIIGARFERDVEPGEVVVITAGGLRSIHPFKNKASSRFCVFEYIYFARPDSQIDGRNVYDGRKRIGAELARESHVDADVVVPVPDSGVPAAIGYAAESGIPFELGIIRNHYVGRTFIEPTQNVRNLGVKLKHNANFAMLKGKRVILVDDSIVRGTTSKKIVQMVREAGAKEVHMRIASPPTTHSCFYGVDTPSREQLMAASHTVEEIAGIIQVDSLAFISLDGLYRAMGELHRKKVPQFCDACFTGDYAIPLIDKEGGEATTKLQSRLAEI
jgi:amidophosphoribosyltransferase